MGSDAQLAETQIGRRKCPREVFWDTNFQGNIRSDVRGKLSRSRESGENVPIPMQHYKFLREAVILVNTQTHSHDQLYY